MQNHYEALKLDVNASLDEIKAAINEAKENQSIDETELRKISSILLNEQLKKAYDEKLFDFLLNGSTAQDNPFAKINLDKIKDSVSSSISKASQLTQDATSSNSEAVVHDKFILGYLGLLVLSTLLTMASLGADSEETTGLLFPLSGIPNFIGLVLLVLDWQLLKTVNKNTFSMWWFLFSPVYIFKRARRLETKQTYFKIFMVIWFVGTIAMFATMIQTEHDKQLKTTACGLVEQLVRRHHARDVSCKSISITSSEGKTHYAFANTVGRSSGLEHIFRIEITEVDDQQIFVKILE